MSAPVTLRVLEDADLEGLRHLIDVASSCDDHRALGEHKWLDLVHGGRREVLGVVARQPGHDHLVGSGHLSRNGSHWGLEVVVHPEHRGIGVELALVERALRIVGAEGGGHVHWWVFKPGETHDAIAHRVGLMKGRDLLQMRRALDDVGEPRWPAGVSVRPFRPDTSDEAEWLRVNNRAFRHHPEQGAWDAETLRRRMDEHWFDASGFILAFDEAGLAGSCWTKTHADEGLGEIYVVGVDPDREGTGLGKALVLAGMRWAASRELGTMMLYVDAADERALGLYRRLGYEVHHLDRAYVADVAPAPTRD